MWRFKSNLRFSSLFVLASLLSAPLSHAMDKEEKDDTNGSFIISKNEPTLSEKDSVEEYREELRELHKSIQEKMEKINPEDQEFVLSVFGKMVNWNEYGHPHLLKFLNAFTEDSKKPQIYKNLYEKRLNNPELSQFHRRTMMVNAVEFGLLKFDKLSSAYAEFSTDQMGVLGNYKTLCREFTYADSYYKYLNALQSLSVKQLEVLGNYKTLRPELCDKSYYYRYLNDRRIQV